MNKEEKRKLTVLSLKFNVLTELPHCQLHSKSFIMVLKTSQIKIKNIVHRKKNGNPFKDDRSFLIVLKNILFLKKQGIWFKKNVFTINIQCIPLKCSAFQNLLIKCTTTLNSKSLSNFYLLKDTLIKFNVLSIHLFWREILLNKCPLLFRTQITKEL